MDSPSVFGAILDRDAGGFRVGPADVSVPAARRYIPGTMVLETSWETRMGWVIVRDALSIGPWHHETERSRTHRRSPTDHDADHVLLRLIECVQGSVEIKLECEPAFDYGGLAADWSYGGSGYGEAFARSEGMDLELRLVTDLRLGFEGPRARARTTLHEGEVAFVALGWSKHPLPGTYDEAAAWLARTGRFWQEWLKHGTFPDHPWRSHLQRSALTLKGLTYAPSGAMIAAATTSLPETPGGDRNWDYRYTWIRDSTFMLWALYTLGFDDEANDFFYFVADVVEAEEGQLQVMYGIGGESKLEEQELEHLSGYDHARPVRIGNGAYDQQQHDVWGAVLDSIYLHTRSRDQLPDRLWPIIKRQVEAALTHWRDPDRGIWEVRGEPRHFTSSKLMCWVAADRGARLARIRADEATALRWEAAAAEIHADICAQRPRSARGVRAALRHDGAGRLGAADAAGALPPARRPAHPRHRAGDRRRADRGGPRAALPRRRDRRRLLRRGGHVHDLLVLAGLGARRDRRARRAPASLCEKLLSYASPLALYAEQLDPITGRHLGQLPAGLHASGADQRGRAHHPRRAPARAARARTRARAGPARQPVIAAGARTTPPGVARPRLEWPEPSVASRGTGPVRTMESLREELISTAVSAPARRSRG